MRTLWQDLRYGLRLLLKSPGFTTVAALTLALGIGGTTAVFCVARALFWRALPFRDTGRLIFLTEATKSIPDLSISYPDFLDWQQQVEGLDGVAAYQETHFDFERNGVPERVSARNVSSSFFQILGITPALGRGLVPADNADAAPAVLVSSYSFWQTHLGANPNAIGTTLRLSGRAFTLVGVLPRNFTFETPADLYAPIEPFMNPFLKQNRAKHPFIYGIARLKPGVGLAEVQTELETISRRLQQQYPASNAGVYGIAKPLQQELAEGAQPTVRALAIAIGLLLLISCANVANLLLTRMSRRQGEFAIRAALGANGSRIVRQILTESVLLGLCGATTGLVLTSACLSSLGVLIPVDLKSMVTLRIDGPTVVFTLLTCLLAAVAFGLLPFVFVSHGDLNEPLKNGPRTAGSGVLQHRLRSALVISEIALAFVVLTSAGLVLRSFRAASHVNPGFELNNVLTMRIELSRSKYSSDNQLNAFFQQALRELGRLPGVLNTAAVFPLPFTSQGYSYGFYIEGQPIPRPGQLPSSNFHFVTPGYFDVMRIPLVQGRDFSAEDNEKSPRVAVVSQNFAVTYWPSSDPIGKRIHLDPAEGGTPVTVIGIVGNTKEVGLDTATETELYLPYAQQPIPLMTFVVRTRVPPLGLRTTAVNALHSVDSIDPLYGIQTMKEIAADVLAKRRTEAFLFSAIGLLIVALSAIGVYAVISHGVSQRTHEIGVRMALGAERAAIARLILKASASVVIVGIGVGTVFALVSARLISNLLFGVSYKDPITFMVVTTLLMLVSLTACYIPARRAMRVDPMAALRHE